MAPVEPKHGRRGEPYAVQYERSVERATRHPQRLRDYVRELEDAFQDETVGRLHQTGVEWEPGDGGSKLGTPRWTAAFRAYVTGPACAETLEGDFRWPLRASIFRLSISRSGTDRLAAAFVFLMLRNRFHVREAWVQQCGILADPAIADAAETWAAESLRRWWGYYVETPRGRIID